jgi:hypothetical protein
LLIALGGGLLAALSSAAAPTIDNVSPWGTVKGRIVWGEKKLPEPKEIPITRDKDAIKECLNGGKWLEENWVVNKDNRGVRWAFVWLAPVKPGSPDAKPVPLPIHPSVKDIPLKNREAVIDVACCRFEPHALAMRTGQVLVVKNSSKIVHNFNLNGGRDFESSSVIMPTGKDYRRENMKASGLSPLIATCNIHPGMKAWVRVFDHPYFAVTDADGKFEIKNAPAGEWRLYIWHEETGWLNKGRRDGEPITIKAEQTKDLGDVEAKEP